MNAPPIPFPPLLVDARADCPHVFTVQCTGTPSDDQYGRTPMGCERRTVYRMPGETDSALWVRVMSVVKHFKDKYGWRQLVAVLFKYDLTVEEGARLRGEDDIVNFLRALKYTAGNDKRARVRKMAKAALASLHSAELTTCPALE